MAKCQGTTKAGKPCSRKAWKGTLYCKLHAPTEEPSESRARANGVGSEFHFAFQEIIDWTKEQVENPTDSTGLLVPVMRLRLDTTAKAIEDLRLRDGLGAGTTHVINVIAPSNKPKPPPEDETAVRLAVGEGEDKERMSN